MCTTNTLYLREGFSNLNLSAFSVEPRLLPLFHIDVYNFFCCCFFSMTWLLLFFFIQSATGDIHITHIRTQHIVKYIFVCNTFLHKRCVWCSYTHICNTTGLHWQCIEYMLCTGTNLRSNSRIRSPSIGSYDSCFVPIHSSKGKKRVPRNMIPMVPIYFTLMCAWACPCAHHLYSNAHKFLDICLSFFTSILFVSFFFIVYCWIVNTYTCCLCVTFYLLFRSHQIFSWYKQCKHKIEVLQLQCVMCIV